MLCSHCKQEPAVFFYSQSIDGTENSVALCEKCAQKAGISAGTAAFSPFLSSFFGNPKNSVTVPRASAKKCSLCASTFEDILSMGKVGCPKCYDTFREELKSTIRSIHGSAKHVGLKPSETQTAPVFEAKDELSTLQTALEQAIRTENYEEAASLRDEIRKLKGEI